MEKEQMVVGHPSRITATRVEGMRKAAKRLRKGGGMPHHQALDAVAAAAGYASWSAVTLALARAGLEPRGVSGATPPHPPIGTPPAGHHGGNSTPASAPVAGLGKSERVGEPGATK